MKRLAIAIVVTALASASAYAQSSHAVTARSDAEKKNDAEIDQAYRQVIKGSEQKPKSAKVDPWQSVRPADADNTKR